MNIALPALVIILGLLPGIVFFHGYFAGRFQKELARITGVSELALYVIFAVPLNAVALAVISGFGIQPDYELLAQLLVGHVAEKAGPDLAAAVRRDWGLAASTYTGVVLGAFLAGTMLRKLVWMFRIDLRLPLLRMKHDWFYILQGRISTLPRGNMLPYADILAEHPGTGVQMYQGIVSGFDVDSDGGIRQILLRDAHKKSPAGWERIQGDRFIVMGAAIQSVNMRYIIVSPAAGAKPPTRGQVWSKSVRQLARSFFFEEP